MYSTGTCIVCIFHRNIYRMYVNYITYHYIIPQEQYRMYSTLSTKLILWNRWFSLFACAAGFSWVAVAVISWLYPFYISLSHQKSIRIYMYILIYIYIYILILIYMCIYYMQYIWIVADIPIISPDGFDIVQVSRTYAYIYTLFLLCI